MRDYDRTNAMSRDLLIDISAAINQRAGIGRYARELTRQLIPILDAGATRLWYAEDESTYDADLLDRDPWRGLPVRRAPISRLNVDRLVFRESLRLRASCEIGRPDDVYSPDFTAPSPDKARTHVTVHDLAWLHPEAETPPPLANFLAPVVERSVRSATTVFTVSEAIRAEIVDRYPIPEERVVLAPNAAAPQFFDPEPLSDERLLSLGLRKPFLLAVGTIDPRKNLTALLDARGYLRSGVQLAVVGRPGWRAPEILGRIEDLRTSGRSCIWIRSDEALPRLMASAAVVIYPSRLRRVRTAKHRSSGDRGARARVGIVGVSRSRGRSGRLYRATDRRRCRLPSSGCSGDVRSRVVRNRKEQARQFTWTKSAEIVARRLQDAG